MTKNISPEKIFAIGDIHGSIRKLELLMKRLPLESETDTLVFIGDYINRGAGSRKVIDFLIDLESRFKRTVFLMGNHEHALLEYRRTKDPKLLHELRSMGVEATLESYEEKSVRSLMDLSFMPHDHVSFLEKLKPFHRQGEYIFVHAGICDGTTPEKCTLETLVGLRQPFSGTRIKDCTIVFGHTPFETPFLEDGMIGIDTGAVYGNMLTALELPTMIFYHT